MKRKSKKETVVEQLSWVELLSRLSPDARSQLKAELMQALTQVSDQGEGKADTSAGKRLAAVLSSDFDFRGFGTNLSYLRMKGSKNELDALWVHPFSMPTLIFSHKRMPVLLMTHPGLRWNKSVLQEMKENSEVLAQFLTGPIDGATG